MARKERPAADPVIKPEDVAAQATRYGFMRVVSLLERLHPDAPRVGGLGPAVDEVVRFRHDPALTFSAADVSHINVTQRKVDPTNELSPTHPCYEVVTTFLGLTGSATPMPLYFAEDVAHEDADSPAQREFLDLFHHRLLGLFYRLRSKYDVMSEFVSDASDPWSKRLLSVAGIDTYDNGLAARLPLWRLLRLSPLLAARLRTQHTLEVALQDVLSDVIGDATVRIEQFVGRWVEIEEKQRMKLGTVNSRLGDDSVIGVKIFDRGGKFRVVIGPLGANEFRRFLPDGDQIPVVRDVVSLCCRDQLEFDLEIVLAKNATPPLRLAAMDGSRLGMDSWLGVREHEETHIVVDVPFAQEAVGAPGADGDGGAGAREPLDAPLGLDVGANANVSSGYYQDVSSNRFPSGEGHHAR